MVMDGVEQFGAALEHPHTVAMQAAPERRMIHVFGTTSQEGSGKRVFSLSHWICSFSSARSFG